MAAEIVPRLESLGASLLSTYKAYARSSCDVLAHALVLQNERLAFKNLPEIDNYPALKDAVESTASWHAYWEFKHDPLKASTLSSHLRLAERVVRAHAAAFEDLDHGDLAVLASAFLNLGITSLVTAECLATPAEPVADLAEEVTNLNLGAAVPHAPPPPAASPASTVERVEELEEEVQTLRAELEQRPPPPVGKIGHLVSIKHRTEEEVQDRFYTPEAIVKSMIEMANLTEGEIVLEPCRGDGAIYNAIPDYCESRWCEIDQGRDFFDYESAEHIDVIITNPPFSLFKRFIAKCVELKPQKLVLLFGCLNITSNRIRMLLDAGYIHTKQHHTWWNRVCGPVMIMVFELGDDVGSTIMTTYDLKRHKSPGFVEDPNGGEEAEEEAEEEGNGKAAAEEDDTEVKKPQPVAVAVVQGKRMSFSTVTEAEQFKTDLARFQQLNIGTPLPPPIPQKEDDAELKKADKSTESKPQKLKRKLVLKKKDASTK